jgi:hypothetical protein
MGHPGLEFTAEELEDHVADEGCDVGDEEVWESEDVGEGQGEGFALSGRAVELPHEQVGIEEEDDEADFDDSAEEFGERAGRSGLAGHGCMVQKCGSTSSGKLHSFELTA